MNKITQKLLVTSLSTTMILSQGVAIAPQFVLAADEITSATLKENTVYHLQLVGSGWTKEDAENYFATYVQKDVQVTEHNGQKVIALTISGDSPFDPDNVFYAGSQLAELSEDKKTVYIPTSAITNQQVDIDFDVTSVDYSTQHLRGQLSLNTENTTNKPAHPEKEVVSEETATVTQPVAKEGPLHFEGIGSRADDYVAYFNQYIEVGVAPITMNGEQVIPVQITNDTVTFDEGSLFYGPQNTEPQLSEDKKIAYIPLSEFKDNKVMVDFRLAVPDEYGTFIRGNLSYEAPVITPGKETAEKVVSTLDIELPSDTLKASAGFSIDAWQDVVIKDNQVITARSELDKSYINVMKDNTRLSKEEADELLASPKEGQYQIVYHIEKNGQTQEKAVPLIVAASNVTYDTSATQPLADGVYTITAKAQRIDSPENESILLNFFDPRVKLEVVNGEYIVTFLNTGLGKSVIDFSLSVPTYKDYNDNTLASGYYPRHKETIKHVNSEEFNTYQFKLNSIEDIRQVGVLYTHRGGIEALVGHYDKYKMAFLTFNLDDIKQGWHGFKEEENTKNGESVLQNALVKEGLDLNNNGFVTADELAKAQGEIDLSNYELTDVSLLKNLGAGVTTLKLMNNNITALPEDFFENMVNLENIYLNHNALTSLPSSLSKLSKLQVFKAPHNTISLISPQIFEGSKATLQEIELENNFLTEIPEATLSNLSNVDAIDLSNNHLTTLGHQSFANLTQLSFLNLNNNKLTTLPQTLAQAPKLRTLNINGNLLDTLDLTKLQTPELQNLTANGNIITHLITGKQVGLSKLRTFDVSSNLLTSFDETPFKSLSDIVTLDVALNPFTKQTIVGDRIITPIVSSSIEAAAKDGHIQWHMNGLTPADYVLWSKASSRLKPIVDRTAYEQYLAKQNMLAADALTEEGHNFDTLVRLEKQQADGTFKILEEKQVKQQSVTAGMFNDTTMQPQDTYRITVQGRSSVLGEYQPRVVVATLVTATATPKEAVTPLNTGTLDVLKDNSQEMSTMNKFIEPAINIVSINNQKFVEMTIKNASWWQEFKVNGQDVNLVSDNPANDTRVIRFPLVDGTIIYPASVHVIAEIPGFAYDHQYNVQLKVNVNEQATEEKVPAPAEQVTEEKVTAPTEQATEEKVTAPTEQVTEEKVPAPTEQTKKEKVTIAVEQVSKETTIIPIQQTSQERKVTATSVKTINNDKLAQDKISQQSISSKETTLNGNKKERILPKTGLTQSNTLATGILALLASGILFFRRQQK